ARLWALLARALAGPSSTNAAIDVGGFDFTQIKQPDDELMLPGALKYGGVLGFAPLFPASAGATQIYRAPQPAAPWLSASLLGSHTTLNRAATAPQPIEMVQRLLRQ